MMSRHADDEGDPMRYLLLIYARSPPQPPDPAEAEQVMADYWAYEKAVADAGVQQAGEALQGTETATTVRVKDGERVVTDGPFAETREVLGGFYLIDVPDLDAAIDWAARCPGAKYGTMEVRPIMEFDAPPRSELSRCERASGRRRPSPRPASRSRPSSGRNGAGCSPRSSRQFGDLDLAEEVASDAVAVGAGSAGRSTACPTRPAAWLLTTARRRAVDRLRRDRKYAARLALLQVEADRAAAPPSHRPATATTTCRTSGCSCSSPAATRRCRSRRRPR